MLIRHTAQLIETNIVNVDIDNSVSNLPNIYFEIQTTQTSYTSN